MHRSVLGIGYSLPNSDDFTFNRLSASLDEAAGLEPDFVELPLFAMDVVAAGRVIPQQFHRLKTITAGRSYGYTVHAPLAINLMDEEGQLPRAQAVARASMEVAAELGAVHFVLHTGIFEKQREHEAETLYARQREILAELAELANDLSLTIVVENLFPATPARRTALPSRLAAEIAAIGHPRLRACLDFSHGFINANYNGAVPMTEVAALAPYAKHLHIHDSFGKITHRHMGHRAERLAFGEGDLHMPLGWGGLPWDELMERLVFADGVILNLELAPPYWSELPVSVARLRELATRVKTAPTPV